MDQKEAFPEQLASEVSILTGEARTAAILFRWDEAPEDFKEVKLRLEFAGTSLEARDRDGYFSALCQIRRQLEVSGMLLVCYGASLNVYPSGMSASMGSGEKAYRQTLGKAALTADLVVIFDVGPDIVPATIDAQREFHQQWIKSLQIPRS